MENFDRDFDRMKTTFNVIFAVTVIIMICVFTFNIFVGVKTYQAIDQHGLKSVIERVWEGPNGTIRKAE